MNTWMLVGGGIALVLALLVARGMYVIGSGSDAEFEARNRVNPAGIGSQGFHLLDRLRNGPVPLVSWIENKLGIDGTRAQQRGPSVTKFKECPTCGSRKAIRNGLEECPECGTRCVYE